MTDKPIPRIGVGVIIHNIDGQVLLSQRLAKHGTGYWSFAGGHLEFMESFKECAVREAMEETDLKVGNINFLTVTEDFFKTENKHYMTVFVTAAIISGTLTNTEPEKHSEWQWFDIDNLPTPLFTPIENMLKQNLPLKEILKRNNIV